LFHSCNNSNNTKNILASRIPPLAGTGVLAGKVFVDWSNLWRMSFGTDDLRIKACFHYGCAALR